MSEPVTRPFDNENHVAPDSPRMWNASSCSVGTDESIDASNGGSVSFVRNIINGLSVTDWLVGTLFVLITGFYIYDRGQLQNELSLSKMATLKVTDELRANTIASDLAKFNAQEVRIQAEVNKQLLAALACKR